MTDEKLIAEFVASISGSDFNEDYVNLRFSGSNDRDENSKAWKTKGNITVKDMNVFGVYKGMPKDIIVKFYSKSDNQSSIDDHIIANIEPVESEEFEENEYEEFEHIPEVPDEELPSPEEIDAAVKAKVAEKKRKKAIKELSGE